MFVCSEVYCKYTKKDLIFRDMCFEIHEVSKLVVNIVCGVLCEVLLSSAGHTPAMFF
jgi:hypothetical protein